MTLRTALFFGSFNPVHIGHLAIANYIAEYGNVDEVWFVVSPHNPHKDKKTLLPERERFHMVQEAIGDYPKFRVSDIEFKLPQPSYTVHTLVHLKEKFPTRQFSLIIGSDNLVHFHKWKNAELILQDYPLIVYPRPETPEEIFAQYPQVQRVQAPQMDISSSFIRQAITQGKDVRFYVPPPVWKILSEMQHYAK